MIIKTPEQFIQQAKIIHGSKYDYSLIDSYTNCKTKVKIICKQCNSVFLQTPNKHISARTGCPFCARNNKRVANKKTTEQFIEQCIKKHGNKFDYSRVVYKDRNTPVIITCNICGTTFEQLPYIHLKTNGCKTCSNKNKSKSLSLNTKMFIKLCEQKNKHLLFDYSKVNYVNAHVPIDIICKKCNLIFSQRPYAHLHADQGCPRCDINNISKKEKQWLDKMNLPDDKFHRQVKLYVNNQVFVVDGYNSQTNTVYEFLGDFWHGNPEFFDKNQINPLNKKTFGELYEKTMEKIKTLKQHGFNVVYIWENQWKIQKVKK